MKSRWKIVLASLAAVLAVSATAGRANTEFIAVYGGWAWNDADTAPENGTIYGITSGVENAAGGAILNLDFNEQGGTEMQSLYAAFLLNFVSKDSRQSRRFIRNRFSSWVSAGAGAMRFQREGRDHSVRLMWEGGLGLQYRFTRNFGLRFDGLTYWVPAGNNFVVEGRLGLGFYWGQGR